MNACNFYEFESSVIEALTHLPRGQRVLVIKRTCHADWTSIVKRITKNSVRCCAAGSSTKLQSVFSLFETGIFHFWKINNRKSKQSTPFCGHQDPVRNEDKQLRRDESPLNAGAPAELSKVERVSVILPIIFSLFFFLPWPNGIYRSRGERRTTQMTEFRGPPIIRPWIARCIKVRIDEYMKVSVCTNLDVYCTLPFGNCPYSISIMIRESHSRPLPLGTKANVAQSSPKSFGRPATLSLCYSATLCYSAVYIYRERGHNWLS